MSAPDNLERQLAERVKANVAAAEQAMKAAVVEPWVKGSTGQPRAHPGFAVAERCDELALKFAEELRRSRREQPAAPAGAGRPDPFASVDKAARAVSGRDRAGPPRSETTAREQT